MAKRIVAYPPNGRRVVVTPEAVVSCWRAHSRDVPAQYAVATAQHESNFAVNEIDTEPSGYISKGIYQLSDDEARSVGCDRANLLDLDDSTVVLALLVDRRLKALTKAEVLHDLGVAAPRPRDLWAYLALAHNQGLHAALTTINRHGLDWAAYKKRNQNLAAMGKYGDDCVTGGASWTKELASV